MRKSSILLIIFTLFAGTQTFAQTYADAVKAFNKGFNLAQKENDRAGAVESFITTVEICNSVEDPKADELAAKAKKQIPYQQYKIAGEKLSSNDLQGAIDAMARAKELAMTYDSDFSRKIIYNVDQNIPKLYKKSATTMYQEGNYQAAIEENQKAIDYDSTYGIAYYQIAQNYRKLAENASGTERDEYLNLTLDNYDKALTLGRTNNNNSLVKTSKEQLVGVLLLNGKVEFDGKNYDKAISMYERGLRYDNESANLHYRLAEVFNKTNNSQKALEHAKQALKFEKRGKSETAKIHYEMGTAQMKLGNRAQACSAFEQAAFGDLKNSADYQMKFELKCDQLAQN